MSETPVEKKIRKRGTRLQVLHGDALMTSGGLTKDKLILNEKTGKICSRAEIDRGINLSSKMREKRAESKPVDAPICKPDDIIEEATIVIKPKRVRKTREKKPKADEPVDEE